MSGSTMLTTLASALPTRNASASILDLGDGVFCLEFHAKLNALDPDIVSLMMRAVERAEKEGVGLVIGNDAYFNSRAKQFGALTLRTGR